MTPWPWCWRARQRDTAGTAGGRSPGVPCAAADAPGGLPPKGRGEKLPPRNGETPRLNPSRLRRVTQAALPSRLLAPVLVVHGWGCQAWRAEGAPLKPKRKSSQNGGVLLVRLLIRIINVHLIMEISVTGIGFHRAAHLRRMCHQARLCLRGDVDMVRARRSPASRPQAHPRAEDRRRRRLPLRDRGWPSVFRWWPGPQRMRFRPPGSVSGVPGRPDAQIEPNDQRGR